MSDLSKPILLSGIAGMALYTIVCLTTSLAFLTFYFLAQLSVGFQTSAKNPLAVTLSEFSQAEKRVLTATSTPAAKITREIQTEQIKQLETQEIVLHTVEPPKASATPIPQPPTPDFVLTAFKATALAQIPTQEVQPTSIQSADVPTAWQNVLQKLEDEKLIPSKNGSYYIIPDYEDSWNQTEWQRWTYVDQTPANFVIKAKASWDTTSVAGMAANSGCGFVFRENGAENYYLMYLGVNGRVYLYRMKDGAIKYLGNSIYYPVQSPAGEAEIMLVANDIRFTFFVDGDNVYDIMDGYFLSGRMGLTVVTGSAQGFGTRCKMEEVVLLAIE